ncbi:hypothetical protein LCGC14_2775630 [marine sediment metagenome]|uniref:Uncharacterized protein n=1 Tax=marine sediment metagenome TaxID=412755 RepID=A0A0F9B3J4_9ZZZZ
MKLPKGIVIIECLSIEFSDKDIITLKTWQDFLWIVGAGPVIFKLKNVYYDISGQVAYIWKDKNNENH